MTPQDLQQARVSAKQLRRKTGHIAITVPPLFLSRETAAAALSISTSLLESLATEHEQLKPRKLSDGRTGWLLEDLQSWARTRPVSDLAPPKNSGYGRAGKPAA